MRIGASQYHPGLTVRWERGLWESALVSRLGEHRSVCEATRTTSYNAKPLYVVFDGSGGLACRKTFTCRCDAKRAAEVLVGQWWREKCEREAKAVRYTFRVEGVEKVTAAFRALADAAKKAGESVRATAGIMSRLNLSPDTDVIVTVRDE